MLLIVSLETGFCRLNLRFLFACVQAGIYYEEALAALIASPLKDHFEKGWISHVHMKAALLYSEACYRYGMELHEKEEIAEEIARLRSGASRLAEAKKSSRGAPAQLVEAMNKLEASINCNLERAVKENDRVYLMRPFSCFFVSTSYIAVDGN
ncbi:Endosomal targeting BRO1-like domain-containing protein [Raphanus sativus]|nr:Endosomal targeting BRO1-like domain-containing protein [Raphanus sativus]